MTFWCQVLLLLTVKYGEVVDYFGKQAITATKITMSTVIMIVNGKILSDSIINSICNCLASDKPSNSWIKPTSLDCISSFLWYLNNTPPTKLPLAFSFNALFSVRMTSGKLHIGTTVCFLNFEMDEMEISQQLTLTLMMCYLKNVWLFYTSIVMVNLLCTMSSVHAKSLLALQLQACLTTHKNMAIRQFCKTLD